MLDVYPGKECGGCTVCCTHLGIDAPGFRKPPGVTCANCTDKGCAIHETRPEVCRTFYCGWMLTDLGEEWRPDRAEIVIVLQGGAMLGPADGMKFVLLALDKIFWKPFVDYISALILRGEPVHLCVPGGPGKNFGGTRLSDSRLLRQAIARRDFAAITSVLSQAVQSCIAQKKDDVTFQHASDGPGKR